ncbi:hypothetical protein D3C75_1352250 [compost metagenome]
MEGPALFNTADNGQCICALHFEDGDFAESRQKVFIQVQAGPLHATLGCISQA